MCGRSQVNSLQAQGSAVGSCGPVRIPRQERRYLAPDPGSLPVPRQPQESCSRTSFCCSNTYVCTHTHFPVAEDFACARSVMPGHAAPAQQKGMKAALPYLLRHKQAL